MSDLMGSLGLGQVLGDSTVSQRWWHKESYNWNVYHDAINNVYKVYRFVRHADNIMYFDQEVHEFQTEEYAKWFAGFCNRLDLALALAGLPVSRTQIIPWWLVGKSEPSWSFTDPRTGAKIVFGVDKAGHLPKVDLPEIIRIWIKRSILGRGLKALWYGWGR